ncbi:carboxymuconolactone decarboxylase family protein [Flavobacterium weaverense]|uniref:AhpD family alkylhydroperoxidase n=1 Tax=Flavobacterium weaverense TaxID=271156 RepID=A0A3L9ZXS5_9FLAO|nr:carboxymuconolactone decarboxylase family protein [Flavobacterium weaverense]RMA77246.1 AhpD family alkylhydroperoxidase [Flavobacterium weaverense]
MTIRISIKDLQPEAYKAMMALENYAKSTEVSSTLKELIKIRASQINKCAYCLDMHTEEAIKLGESERRIYLLSAWKESHLFSEDEKAILQLTEEVTDISENGVNDVTYNSVIARFGEKITAQLIMLIVVINSWNRIAISTRMIYKK